MKSDIPPPMDRLAELYDGLGRSRYSDDVTQTEHALQAAALAAAEGASDAVIVAALLHDIGHLIHKLGETPAARGIDAKHEILGARELALWFGPEVTEPVRLHVAAKRYLCAIEPSYFDTLSPGSVRSLQLQGGPLSPEDAELFIRQPFAPEAVMVRRCDEGAKVAAARTPGFRQYARMIETCAGCRAA